MTEQHSSVRSIDMILLDEVFEMGGGYVLDFTNPTFARFFADELNVDIYDAAYAEQGSSKGKRLRCFLQKVDGPTAAKALKMLWEYREAARGRQEQPDRVKNAEGRLLALTNRLEGKTAPVAAAGAPPKPAFDRAKFASLQRDLISLVSLAPHARGYAFEAFLRGLFDAFALEAREPFRVRGEQIDGSFVLHGEIYLVEAKWQAEKTGVADLHAFHGKLNQKAAWARGLFVSNSGFTEDGLVAFGGGKKLICMDGLDLADALGRELPLDHVLQRKVRRAAETGQLFARVRDLFAS